MESSETRTVVLVVGFTLLHFSLRPLFIDWPVAPDLLTAAVLLGGLFLRAGSAAILGFSLGILEDAMALGGGWTALLYTIAAYTGARFRDLIFADSRLFVPLYLFLGTWAIHASIAALTGSLDVTTGLVIAPIDAVLTTVAGGLGELLIARASR